MLTYHPLRVSELRPETADAICITLEVPQELEQAYRYLPGQHVGLRAQIDGQEVRRSYSLCAGTDQRHLRIAIRQHDQGSMSQYLARQVHAGDRIDVLPPAGGFFVQPDPAAARTYCAFAAGSGITPILGILHNVLLREPNSRFLLFYGNRTASSIMFAEELLALKDRYPERLSLYFILSREPQDVELFNGRIDAEKVARFAAELFDPRAVDAFLLCGPGTMVETVKDSLVTLGADPTRIHSEHFASDAPRALPGTVVQDKQRSVQAQTQTRVTVVMDGRRRGFTMGSGMTVLEAAESAGLDLPYSCRAGVCSTCRARVVRGEVSMMTNYSLEQGEVDAGYVLCCQALPTSTELELTYDER